MTLKVKSLSKQFKAEQKIDAVKEACIHLEKGRFLAITGRSGSGKSTLLAMIGGISRPTSGTVLIDGTNLWQLNENARANFLNQSIGFVFQFASLLPSLRAIDNVALPALIGGNLNYKEAYARARALLIRVGLAERANFYPNQLSGGEQRRVAIARALINMPKILLADEPTADLDEETEEEILNLLVEIHRTFDLTLVVVTHNPAIADRADQVIQMKAGQVVAKELETAGISRQREQAQNSAENLNATFDSKAPTRDLSSARELATRELYNLPAHLTAKETRQLGDGIEKFIGRLVLFVVPIILVTCGINAAISMYQNRCIQEQINKQAALEELAMKGLRADIKTITPGPGKSYILQLYLRNTTEGEPLYVMSPVVRGFIQVGSNWQEIALKPLETAQPQVAKITGERLYNYTFETDTTDFAKLIPYYMHIRFTNEMLISPRSQPKEDLIARADSYYVYLKPHNADSKAILKALKFPGDPPVWIPMPPH